MWHQPLPEKTIPVVLDKPVGSVNTCRFRNKKSDIETLKNRLLMLERAMIAISNYLSYTDAAAWKHSIPSRSSISATVLKEKLTFPERILLTY